MRKNKKADQKYFYESVVNILKEYGEVKETEYNAEMTTDTPFGKLQATVYREQEHVWTVFMRFLEKEKFPPEDFKACFKDFTGSVSDINWWSLKWNIHSVDMEGDRKIGRDYVINETEERLDNLKWLETKENYNLVLNNN